MERKTSGCQLKLTKFWIILSMQTIILPLLQMINAQDCEPPTKIECGRQGFKYYTPQKCVEDKRCCWNEKNIPNCYYKEIENMAGLTRFSVDEGRLIMQMSVAGEKCRVIATKINSQRNSDRADSYCCTSDGVRNDGKYSTCSKQNKVKDEVGLFVVGHEVSIQWTLKKVERGVVVFVDDNRSKCDAEEKALALGIAKSKQPENSRKRRKGTFSLAGKKIKLAPGMANSKQLEAPRKRRKGTVSLAGKRIKLAPGMANSKQPEAPPKRIKGTVSLAGKKIKQVSFEERGKPAGVILHSANSPQTSEIMQSPDVQAIILAYSKLTPQEQIAVQLSVPLVAAARVGLSSQTTAEATSKATAENTAHIPALAPEPAHKPAPATPPALERAHKPSPPPAPAPTSPQPSRTIAPSLAPAPALAQVHAHIPEPAPALEHAAAPAPVYSSELAQEPEAAPALAPAQAPAPGPAHTPEAAPAQEYAHIAAPPPASAPVFTPVHAQNPAPALAHAPASPNHLLPFAMHSINISGFAFLPPGTPPDPMLQRQSTPVGRNDLANQLYEWSSPAASRLQSCDTRFSSEELINRIMRQECEIEEFKRQQNDLLMRIEALENASIATSSVTCRSAASSRPKDIFSNGDLLRVKAALFVVGRQLTSDYCKELVSDLYENEPALNYDIDTLRAINESKRCSDAPALSKWAVLELFSLGELAGRNCTGRSSTGSVDKLPLDRIKLKFIRESVLEIYPQRSEGARRDVWNKCVEKINSQLRYLFQTSLTKHPWLNIGL